jgi:hypothetical protein
MEGLIVDYIPPPPSAKNQSWIGNFLCKVGRYYNDNCKENFKRRIILLINTFQELILRTN